MADFWSAGLTRPASLGRHGLDPPGLTLRPTESQISKTGCLARNGPPGGVQASNDMQLKVALIKGFWVMAFAPYVEFHC